MQFQALSIPWNLPRRNGTSRQESSCEQKGKDQVHRVPSLSYVRPRAHVKRRTSSATLPSPPRETDPIRASTVLLLHSPRKTVGPCDPGRLPPSKVSRIDRTFLPFSLSKDGETVKNIRNTTHDNSFFNVRLERRTILFQSLLLFLFHVHETNCKQFYTCAFHVLPSTNRRSSKETGSHKDVTTESSRKKETEDDAFLHPF